MNRQCLLKNHSQTISNSLLDFMEWQQFDDADENIDKNTDVRFCFLPYKLWLILNYVFDNAISLELYA